MTGTAAQLRQAIAYQQQSLGALPKLNGIGNMSNVNGFQNRAATVADSITNLWITTNDMRAAVQDIKESTTANACKDIIFSCEANIVRQASGAWSHLALDFTGSSIPTGYTDCGTGNRTKGLPELSNNYSAGVPYGYFAGGDEPGVPGQVSKIDRLDYDNDTVACLHKGNMISAVEQCVSWSTLNYFYTTNGTGSKVQRLSYTNDTGTASERSSSGISPGQRRFAVQNTNYGYIGG